MAIYVTYALQFYVPIEIIVRHLTMKYGHLHVKYIYIIRLVLSTLCVLVAFGVPNIGGIISLIGAICLSILGIILPALFDLMVFKNEVKHRVWRLIKDWTMVAFGIFGLVTGTCMSIYEIIYDLWPHLIED